MDIPSLISKNQKCYFRSSNLITDESVHNNFINRLPCNNKLTVLVPGSTKTTDLLKTTLQQMYFTVNDVPLLKLIDVEFIEAFVKKGDIYMLSQHSDISSDICCAIRPPGVLELNVTKDVYEELGLEGRSVTCGGRRSLNRFLISLDLTAESFKPGKKNYERVIWCFTDRLELNVDLFVSWIPKDDRICPSSIGAYFANCGYTSTPGKWTRKCRKVECVTPVVETNSSTKVESEFSNEEFYEWLGMVACQCDTSGDVDEYVSTYSCPEPTDDSITTVTRIVLNGFHCPRNILVIISQLRDFMKTNSALPWVSLTTHCLPSPLSLTNHFNGYSRDRLNTFVIFPNSDYWIYSTDSV